MSLRLGGIAPDFTAETTAGTSIKSYLRTTPQPNI